jgi:hypothetical protein
MRAAVDPSWVTNLGGHPDRICGVVAVSGAGYDMEDELTQRLDADKTYYNERFAGSIKEVANDPSTRAWRREASVLHHLDASDPPFLSVMAGLDYASIQRQMRLADERLQELGLSKGFVIVPNADHEKIVLRLSKKDQTAMPQILTFLRDTPCPRP